MTTARDETPRDGSEQESAGEATDIEAKQPYHEPYLAVYGRVEDLTWDATKTKGGDALFGASILD